MRCGGRCFGIHTATAKNDSFIHSYRVRDAEERQKKGSIFFDEIRFFLSVRFHKSIEGLCVGNL